MVKEFNLLIVDDEEPLRVLLESELSDSEEFAVDTAADGGQAINKIQAKATTSFSSTSGCRVSAASRS